MNYVLGIFLIMVGIWVIYFTYNNPDSQLISSDFKGYLGGIMAIIIGFMIVLEKFTL